MTALCSICPTVSESIKQCSRGHLICSRCGAKMTKCLFCIDHQEIDDDTCTILPDVIQAKNLELKRSGYGCKYEKEGCYFRYLKSEDQIHHEKNGCMFKLINCIVPECPTAIPIVDFCSHMRDEHDTNTDEIHDNPFKGNILSDEFVIMKADDLKFMKWVWMPSQNNKNGHGITVCLLGSKEQAKGYYYEINIDKDEKEFHFKCPVVSIDEMMSEKENYKHTLEFSASLEREFSSSSSNEQSKELSSIDGEIHVY